ncbi:MAG: transglutaminase domain-containing protein [Pseudanabaenaceae cyanobacterium]
MSSSPSNLIFPIATYVLHGVAISGNQAISLDVYRGYVVEIDLFTEATKILNSRSAASWRELLQDNWQDNLHDLAVTEHTLWLTLANRVYCTDLTDFELQLFAELPEPVQGIAVSEGGVYLASRQAGKIFMLGRSTRTLQRVLPIPGHGWTALTLHDHYLWACDRQEETIYCLDPRTGEIWWRALTPFRSPVGLDFWGDLLYVLYTQEERYIAENPNQENPYSIERRDRSLLHQLRWQTKGARPRYTLSNGYLVEMVYVEETYGTEPIAVKNLNWRIALPSHSDRQVVRSVEAVGLPFREEEQAGQRVAVFNLGDLRADEAHYFGWRALLELRGIKYELTPAEVADVPPLAPEMRAQYLVDDDDLAMDRPVVVAAAREAGGGETNILKKIINIRNYVYDKLEYRMRPYISPPDEALQRGTASCGEYVGVLLALLRLNGIACRTVGRYKCPPYPDQQGVILHQYYNHVWVEFYIPTIGWLPMESNPDDTGQPPYPTRWFMGLPWFHVEIGKGITFETIKPQPYSIGELALNHVRFRILAELP